MGRRPAAPALARRVNADYQDFKYTDLTDKIIEIKASRCLVEENEAQLLNYLKATKIEIGLLLNFGIKPEIKRKAYDNLRKHYSANIRGNLRPNFRIGG